MEKRAKHDSDTTDKSPPAFTSVWLTWGEKSAQTGQYATDATDKSQATPPSVSFVSASPAQLQPNALSGAVPFRAPETPLPSGQPAPDVLPRASTIFQTDVWACDTDVQAQ